MTSQFNDAKMYLFVTCMSQATLSIVDVKNGRNTCTFKCKKGHKQILFESVTILFEVHKSTKFRTVLQYCITLTIRNFMFS